MNTQQSQKSRVGIILIAGLSLACAGLVWQNRQQAGEVTDLRGQVATLQTQTTAAARKMAMAAQTTAAGTLQHADGSAGTAGTPADAASVLAASEAKAQEKRIMNAQETQTMMHNSGMQKIMASQRGAVVQMTYGDLMNHLQLSPQERDYLQNLLLERQSNIESLGIQLTNPALSADDRASIGQQLKTAWMDGEAKIKDFINSDADYAYYQSYYQQEPERQEIGMMETGLDATDALQPAQADALAAMQSQARKDYPFTVDFYNKQNWANPQVVTQTNVTQFFDQQQQFQAQMAQQAATILTPAQLQAYTQNQQAARQMMKMQLNGLMQMTGGGQ